MFGCDERKQSRPCTTCGILGAKQASSPLEDFCHATFASVPTWNGEATKPCHPQPPPPPLASVHTCTAISKLINCESRSLETLNHSFSVLSQAANLAALTGVPPCLPNTGDGDGRGGGHGRFPVGGVAANRRGKQPMWTVRVGAKMSAAISRKMYNSDCEGVGFFGGWNNPTHWFHVHTHTPLPLC